MACHTGLDEIWVIRARGIMHHHSERCVHGFTGKPPLLAHAFKWPDRFTVDQATDMLGTGPDMPAILPEMVHTLYLFQNTHHKHALVLEHRLQTPD